MEVNRDPLPNPSEDFQRPPTSYSMGKYSGYNPMFAGNDVAPSKAADWNWLSLHFSPLQSSIQAGGTLNLSGVTLANPRIFGATFPDKTQGSVLFIGPGSVLTENNASFFWDNALLSLQLTGGATANPYLKIGPAGAGSTGQFIMKVSSSQASTKNFNFISAEKGNSSDARNNVHWKLGYNIDKFSEDPEDITEPSIYFAWESFYQTGADRVMESYVEYLSASATPVLLRPWYTAVSRLTDTIKSVLHSSENHYWYNSADQSALAANYWMNLSSSGLTLDPTALFSMQLLLNSAATPTTSQFEVKANSLGAVSILAYAASNVHVGFDLDWASSAFKARHTTCARISSNAGTWDFVVYGGQTIGNTVTGAILSVSIDEVTGNRTYVGQDLKANGTVAAPSDSWSAQPGFGWRRFGTGSLALTDGTNDRFIIIGTSFPGITIASAGNFSWSNTGDARTGTADVVTVRDGAGIWALKNLTNPQTARIYGNATGSKYTSVSHDGTDALLAASSGDIGIQPNGLANGQKVTVSSVTELTTIAAAATTATAIQIPLDAVVFAVSVRVTVAIPTAVTFTVTGTTSATQFDVAGGVAVAVNTTDVGTRNCPYKNGAAQTITITPSAVPANNNGRVRVTIHYYKITVATS